MDIYFNLTYEVRSASLKTMKLSKDKRKSLLSGNKDALIIININLHKVINTLLNSG